MSVTVTSILIAICSCLIGWRLALKRAPATSSALRARQSLEETGAHDASAPRPLLSGVSNPGEGELERLRREVEALRFFREAVDLSADPIYMTDAETKRFVDFTAMASTATGFSREELLQMGPHHMMKLTTAQLDEQYQALIADAENGHAAKLEVGAVVKDGREGFTEVHRRAKLIGGRWIILSTARDITERRTAEIAAQRLERTLAALNATNEAILHMSSPQQLYQEVCDAAVNGGKFLAAFICQPLGTSSKVTFAAHAGTATADLATVELSSAAEVAEGRGVVGTTLRTGTPTVCNDVMAEPHMSPWHKHCEKTGVAASAALPFVREGAVVGVLLLVSKERGAFDTSTMTMLSRMARNITFALETFDRHQDQQRAEEQLRETEARLDRITRGTNDGIWEFDITKQRTWVSPLFAEMHGYRPEDFGTTVGKLYSLMHPEDSDGFRSAFEDSLASDAPLDVRVRAQRRDGEWRWYRFRAAIQRDASGRALTVSGSQRDVTEDHQRQQELIDATESAAAANRAKSEFLANMSHEIRTPMNGVIGMTDLLLDTQLTDLQRDYADTVRSSAAALLTVINDILDFSKVEAGKLQLENLDMDLRDTIEDVARLISVQAHAKDLEVITLFDPDLPDRMHGDAGRLRQLLLNLGGNAVKFTQAGEISITCKVVERNADNVLVRCEIADTGIGIPAHRIGALFNAFTQVDGSTARKFGGTGLGLSIVKHLVELMGGETGVDSTEGAGSTFWFTARLSVAVDAVKSRAIPPVELQGKRVLVVDDNATNRKVLGLQLSQFHMDAVCASTADEALELMRRAAADGRPFSAALIDHQMPGCNGGELGQRIAADASLSGTQLALLTSVGRRGDGRRFAELGFAAYLVKPVTKRDLVDSLVIVLGARPQAQAPRLVTRHELRVQRASSNRRILLAEDNIVNQKVACRILEKLGFRVDVAGDGGTAIKAWQTERYDAILMDCQMPEIDGYEASRRIRQLEQGRTHIPIIALTAHAMLGASEECIAAGMDDYLTKPIDPVRLQAVLARWLSHEYAEARD